MIRSSIIRGERFRFPDLRTVFAKANEPKSGDELAGLAASSERERVAAKQVLADLSLKEIVSQPLLDPDQDEVSRTILEGQDHGCFAPLAGMTVGEFREWILSDDTTPEMLGAIAPGITSEIAAAIAKIMGTMDLVRAASKIRVVTRCRNTMGQPGVFGIRLQPNHPRDDLAGIVLASVDGLLHGCGDAVIGVNPAAESVESVAEILRTLDRLISLLQIPTQHCCLAHATTQLAALEQGAPIDLLFQSIAGTESANHAFGVSRALLDEGRARVLEARTNRNIAWAGRHTMYFETGQGSALSAGAHHGIDQLTIEARAYGFARAFDPFLVNSVVGFIGPEYLYDERQIIRAGLEDHFMGKLLGLPMGVDVCYTNHAQADQNSAENLLILLAAAGCNYVMGVPSGDDVMLNYQSTSFQDAVAIRQLLGLRPAPEFERWLQEQGLRPRSSSQDDGERARIRTLDRIKGMLEANRVTA